MATFPCPTCQKPVEWSAASVWRPFCSERCRLIDLGAWFTEQRAIPGAGASSEEDSDEDQGPQDEDAARRH